MSEVCVGFQEFSGWHNWSFVAESSVRVWQSLCSIIPWTAATDSRCKRQFSFHSNTLFYIFLHLFCTCFVASPVWHFHISLCNCASVLELCFFFLHISVTKRYNLVLAKGWGWCGAEKVSADLPMNLWLSSDCLETGCDPISCVKCWNYLYCIDKSSVRKTSLVRPPVSQDCLQRPVNHFLVFMSKLLSLLCCVLHFVISLQCSYCWNC